MLRGCDNGMLRVVFKAGVSSDSLDVQLHAARSVPDHVFQLIHLLLNFRCTLMCTFAGKYIHT